MYSPTPSLTSALDGVGGQRHVPAALPPGKSRYPLYRRLGGPQSRSGWVRKISAPTGIRSPDRLTGSESLYRQSYPGPRGGKIPLIFRLSTKFSIYKRINLMQLGSMFICNCNIALHVSDAFCVHLQEHLEIVEAASGE